MILQFGNYYDLHETLGKGTFGTVKRCVQKNTGKTFAVKIIAKTVDKRAFQDTLHEAEICRRLRHPNVVRLLDTYDHRDALYLVFDLVVGGELMHEIQNRNFYSEDDGSYCMQQILGAIDHCHKKGIAHCDLKPENILLASKERGAAIKIADFGLAAEVEGNECPLRGIRGTLPYMAPEIIGNGYYGKPVDMWACGVILYILIVGTLPFDDRNDKALNLKILNGIYKYPLGRHETISADAKDIIKRMLTMNSRKRITAADALQHRWIRQRDNVAPKKHLGETIVRLKAFNARRKFKGAIFAVKAAQMFGKKPSRNDNIMKSVDGSELVRMTNASNNGEDVKQEIIKLTETLADAWNIGDMRTVYSLCDPMLTTFDPEYGVVSGIRDIVPYHNDTNTMILEPYVHLLGHRTAYIAYIRSTEYIQRNCLHIEEAEETRVWRKRGGKWLNVHFHNGFTDEYEEEDLY